VREVYTKREAIVAGIIGLALAAIIWGPILLRPFGYVPAVDLRTLRPPDDTLRAQARLSASTARVVKTTPAGSVDINHADDAELQRLPGIGPTLAKRIIKYRQAHGPFQDVDGLMEVEGIGPKRLERLKPWVKAR